MEIIINSVGSLFYHLALYLKCEGKGRKREKKRGRSMVSWELKMVLLLSAQEHLLRHLPEYLLVTALLPSIIFLILRWRTRRRDAPIRRSSIEKGPGREPGGMLLMLPLPPPLTWRYLANGYTISPVWIPLAFESPIPPPYPDWDISTTKPLPYRPFRYGPKYSSPLLFPFLPH